MVKRLKYYTGCDKVKADEGRGIFPAKITFEDGSYYLNYLDRDLPPREIYSKGNKRVSLVDGVFRVGQDRKWKKIVELL